MPAGVPIANMRGEEIKKPLTRLFIPEKHGGPSDGRHH
jgi:hypothetical protein